MNLSKLDFLNKMTLRRKAGRLDGDGIMTESGDGKISVAAAGKDGLGERQTLLTRFKGYLKEQKVLQGW